MASLRDEFRALVPAAYAADDAARPNGLPIREPLERWLSVWRANPANLEAFARAVVGRLDRYAADTQPEKEKYLGTLSNFLTLGRWQDETEPLRARAAG